MLPFLKEENLSDEEKLQIEDIFWLKVLRAGIHENEIFSERIGIRHNTKKVCVCVCVGGGGIMENFKFEFSKKRACLIRATVAHGSIISYL